MIARRKSGVPAMGAYVAHSVAGTSCTARASVGRMESLPSSSRSAPTVALTMDSPLLRRSVASLLRAKMGSSEGRPWCDGMRCIRSCAYRGGKGLSPRDPALRRAWCDIVAPDRALRVVRRAIVSPQDAPGRMWRAPSSTESDIVSTWSVPGWQGSLLRVVRSVLRRRKRPRRDARTAPGRDDVASRREGSAHVRDDDASRRRKHESIHRKDEDYPAVVRSSCEKEGRGRK